MFDEHKEAKWSHIEELFSIDSSQQFRVIPRVTKAHMEAKGLSAMRVKLAAQVLSHSVAAGLCLLTATKHLPPEAAFTAEFIGQIDELFDSFNSRSIAHTKEFAAAVSKNSNHVEM